ncbi:hypothetical protein F4X10_14950 [Candidatus Poribacteria bacterium]|nr:hypothetical protein [Candidatus Poribacteria bacterium]
MLRHPLFNISDDSAEIGACLQQGQHLCFLLNPGLRIAQKMTLTNNYYLFAVSHKGAVREAVACGYYKHKQDDLERVAEDDSGGSARWFEGGDNPILEDLIESPLSILLSEALAPNQLEMLKRVFEVIEVRSHGRRRNAVACVYYDPDEEVEGQILSHFRVVDASHPVA